MAEERSLDPRFDPRYQRGFDPATMPVDPETLRAPVEEIGAVPPTSPVVPVQQEAVRLEPDDDEDHELAALSTRNPFRLALLFVSIGFLVLATALLWWTATNQSAYLSGSAAETAQGWMFQSLTGILPPAAIVAGFVGIAIWLGLGALDARANAEGPREEPRDE